MSISIPEGTIMNTAIYKLLIAMATVWIVYPNHVDTKSAGAKLSDSILHYEPVYYNHHQVHQQHHRSKRATPSAVSLQFTAFGRHFNLSLYQDRKLFSSDAQIETTNGHVTYDIGRAYTGNLNDESVTHGSQPTVRGIITTTGHFQGTISRDSEVYIIEKATKYFPGNTDFHSVIYRASDVTLDVLTRTCGEQKHRKNLLKLQKSLQKDIKTKERTYTGQNPKGADVQNSSSDDVSDWSDDHGEHSDWSEKYLRYERGRHKRATPSTKTTCELYMQADHLYYGQLGSDVEAVIEELSRSVQAVNSIYGKIDFDGDGSPDNINFIIKRLKIHTDPTVSTYKYNGNFGVETFLQLHSEENYDAYCLSYIFTHRDFDGGVLGLAWTAGKDQSGGVCEKYASYAQGSLSLNTGLVTTLNYGKTVSPLVTHLTLAHEIGHNMGSPHDVDQTSCAPGGTAGNYIMYARAITGSQDNNDKFSTCSVQSMGPIITDVARAETGCFVEPMTAICGNKVVEEGEECDCGYTADCNESCCNPQTDTTGGPTPCTRKSSSVCSPSSGPCCDTTCQFITAASNHVCRANTSCLDAAICNGTSASCPASDWVPDRTPCEDNQVCINGTCSGSACLTHDYPSCQCAPAIPGNWKDPKLCSLCCEVGGQCKPSYEIAGIANGTNVAGSPCNNYMGYCDVFYRCREVDPTGTFSTILKLLNPERLETIKQWLITHWYVPVLATLGFIILMVIFVKVCGKRVPSDKELYERRMRRYGNNNMPLAGRGNTVAPTGYM